MSTVLYRKYRAKTFADIRGQDTIVKVISASVASGQISHAYLFSGPRGTGKTSMARLLAVAVNSSNFAELGDIDPKSELSLQVESGSFMDLIEIDAASNRGIEEIRQIRDGVNFRPGVGKYKVYIIDEVHMLTREAFNALLKTLEEPPSHAIFILATTEPHKVPQTVLSRVQRFDFKLASKQQMLDKLTYIINEEGIQIPEEGLELIHRHSGGSYRDAESMLGKVLMSVEASEAVDLGMLTEILGMVSRESITDFITLCLKGDVQAALGMLDQLESQGVDFHRFTNQIINELRDMITVKIGNDSQINLELALLKKFIHLNSEYKYLNDTKMMLEIGLFDLAKNTPEQIKTSNNKNNPTKSVPLVNKSKELKVEVKSEQSNGANDQLLWSKVLAEVKSKGIGLWAHLKVVRVVFGDQEVTISSSYQKSMQQIQSDKNLAIIKTAIKKVAGKDLELSFQIGSSDADPSVLNTNENLVETIF